MLIWKLLCFYWFVFEKSEKGWITFGQVKEWLRNEKKIKENIFKKSNKIILIGWSVRSCWSFGLMWVESCVYVVDMEKSHLQAVMFLCLIGWIVWCSRSQILKMKVVMNSSFNEWLDFSCVWLAELVDFLFEVGGVKC